MAKLINELLLLTCMGGFIASATYAVTPLHAPELHGSGGLRSDEQLELG